MAGQRVTLAEHDRPGAGASSAAFGSRQLQAGPGTPPPLLALWQAARRTAILTFVAAIEAASGLGVAFRSEGRLLVALDAAREAALATFLADQRAAGIPAAPLTAVLVDELVRGAPPSIDLAPFAPARFDPAA